MYGGSQGGAIHVRLAYPTSLPFSPAPLWFRPLVSLLDALLTYILLQVWDLATLSLRARLTGHTGAVLALQLVKERDWLISASGEAVSLYAATSVPH